MASEWDTQGFVNALASARKALPSQLAQAVTGALTAGRTASLKVISKELRLPRREITNGDRRLRASPNRLAAKWWPSPRATPVTAAANAAKAKPGEPLTFTAYSKRKSVARAFLIRGKAFKRFASAAGKSGRMSGLKQVKLASPATLVSQEDNTARMTFDVVARDQLASRTAGKIEVAFARAGFKTSNTGKQND